MDKIGTVLAEHMQRRLGGNTSDTETSEAAEITFTIIFYSLFALMLVVFWFVFKRGQKN